MKLLIVSLISLVVASNALLEVRMMGHSHCDAGWLYPAGVYYQMYVNNILDSVIDSLSADKSLRFNWAETAWIQMWWEGQTEERHAQLRQLVDEGRFEFVGGGWSMQDQTVSVYDDVIDMVTTGHEWLRRNLGSKARVRRGWDIDMFSGYSSVTPTLWALNGYDSTVIRYEGFQPMHDHWAANKWFEFLWDASPNLDRKESEIFTHCIEHNYGDLMRNLSWEYTDNNPPVTPLNVQTYAALFTAIMKNMSQFYQGPFLAVWGSDFRFHNASWMFGNMSLIINYLNSHQSQYGVHVKYTTLSEYFDELHALGLSFPRFSQLDFEVGWPHPIGIYNNTIQYQTGAHTSRPGFKGLIRHSNSILRPAEALYVLAKTSVPRHDFDLYAKGNVSFNDIEYARQQRGLVQHHDSLAGTMTALDSIHPGPFGCLEDYISRLHTAISKSNKVSERMISLLVGKDEQYPLFSSDIELMQRELQPGVMVPLVIFNSLGWTRRDVVNMTVNRPDVSVVDAEGNSVPAEIYLEQDTGLMTLFIQIETQALSWTTVFLTVASDKFPAVRTITPVKIDLDAKAGFSMENSVYRVTFEPRTGNLARIENKVSGARNPTHQEYRQYVNGTGGAYILVEPNKSQKINEKPVVYYFHGSFMQQVFQYHSDNLWLKTRLYNAVGGNHNSQASLEMESYIHQLHHVGPIPLNREYITIIDTDLNTQGSWFTDTNGLEMFKRQFNPNLAGNVIGGNYHAMVSTSYIQDASTGIQLTAMSKQSMGVTSLQIGQLELMLHRRTNFSDQQGPFPLNDSQAITVDLRLSLDYANNTQMIRRKQNLVQEFPVSLFFSVSSLSVSEWVELYNTNITYITNDLPDNVHLLSLKPRDGHNGESIFRLNHICEKSDGTDLSKSVSIDLNSHFAKGFVPNKLVERSLSLQQTISEMHRQEWKGMNGTFVGGNSKVQLQDDADIFEDKQEQQEFFIPTSTISLNPIQIKSYTGLIGNPPKP